MKKNFTKPNQSIPKLKIYSVLAALSFFPGCVNKETVVVYEPVVTEVKVKK